MEVVTKICQNLTVCECRVRPWEAYGKKYPVFGVPSKFLGTLTGIYRKKNAGCIQVKMA